MLNISTRSGTHHPGGWQVIILMSGSRVTLMSPFHAAIECTGHPLHCKEREKRSMPISANLDVNKYFVAAKALADLGS